MSYYYYVRGWLECRDNFSEFKKNTGNLFSFQSPKGSGINGWSWDNEDTKDFSTVVFYGADISYRYILNFLNDLEILKNIEEIEGCFFIRGDFIHCQ
jgi:hypothetical protein